MKRILCYEINEVPWRVVDFYVSKRPGSTLASLLPISHQFTSNTVDSGELHPWSTWPTLHRGVSNDVHGIRFLNQDLSGAKNWPPIWDLLAKSGVSVGIFGSLQSYPVVQHENILFHIPDTFSAGNETHPSKYSAFQAFNLKQTGENKAVASKLSLDDAKSAFSLLRSGISIGSLSTVARHLIEEKRNPLNKRRRTLLQPVLAFDVFLDCLKNVQPQFVTFFSNHVAGIMHRYWKYTFPEDFDYSLTNSAEDKFHSNSILVAMDLLDKQLEKLLDVCDKHEYELILVSSMGQEAIERGEYIPELRLNDFSQFKRFLDLPFDYRLNLAMQPDVAFEFDNQHDLHDFESTVKTLKDEQGLPILEQRLNSVGNTLNLRLARSKAVSSSNNALFGDRQISVAELGMDVIKRDVGTGYHQPEGIWIWNSANPNLNQNREKVDSRQFLPTMLQHFNISESDYMMPPVPITGI